MKAEHEKELEVSNITDSSVVPCYAMQCSLL